MGSLGQSSTFSNINNSIPKTNSGRDRQGYSLQSLDQQEKIHNNENPSFELNHGIGFVNNPESFQKSTVITITDKEQFANNSEFEIQTRIAEQEGEIPSAK